jgi:outer membrane protein OmpA-like peptidoglycan-associated protein
MKILRTGGLFFLLFLILVPNVWAQIDKSFNVIQFPEGRTVKVGFISSGQIPSAQMRAEVKFQEGQFQVELKFEKMKSAILFGGDVTCYVLWAINRDGAPENLGELWVRPDSDKDTVKYSTGLRNFALAVTGEKYSQVPKPSEMVLFWNDSRPNPAVRTDPLVYKQFSPAPANGVSTLESVRYDGKKPLDLVQAEKVFKMAQDLGAEKLAVDLFTQASLTLKQATQIYERSQGKGAQRFARDSVAASNEAIRLTNRKLELAALEKEYAERQAQMAELEGRANQAEEQVRAAEKQVQASEVQIRAAESQVKTAEATILKVQQQRAEAERKVASAQSSLEKLNAESARLTLEKGHLETSLASLNAERTQLEMEKASLLAEKQTLQQDKEDLQGRLRQALSQVAETHSSARGLILNLPDILFSVGEADLKPGTRIVMAKLSGILLMMQDLNLRIEGHTDSTGAPSFNLRLSERRADAVFDFMAIQGIGNERMKTAGYGMERPLADNATASGRSQNRRVEIIIAEGEIAAQ